MLFRSSNPVNHEGFSPLQGGQPLTNRVIVDALHPDEFGNVRDVTIDSAKSIAAVFRSVNVVSSAVYSIEKNVVNANSGKPINSHTLIHQPNTMMDGVQFLDLMMNNLLLAGDFIAIMSGVKGSVTNLTPLNPRTVDIVAVVSNGSRPIVKDILYKTVFGDDEVGIPADEILHIAGYGFDGLRGTSVIKNNARVLDNAISTDEYASRFYKDGALLSGILTTDKRIDEKTAEGLKQRWRKKIQGIENAFDIVVLDSGTSFEPISISPEESQFIEARKFNVEEIGRLFGLSPSMLGQAPDADPEKEAITFVQFTMKGWYSKISSAFERQVLKRNERLKFHPDTLIMPDLRTRSSAAVMFRNSETVSINEIRIDEGRAPINDPRADDVFYKGTEVNPTDPGGNAGNEDPLSDVIDEPDVEPKEPIE